MAEGKFQAGDVVVVVSNPKLYGSMGGMIMVGKEATVSVVQFQTRDGSYEYTIESVNGSMVVEEDDIELA